MEFYWVTEQASEAEFVAFDGDLRGAVVLRRQACRFEYNLFIGGVNVTSGREIPVNRAT